MLFSLGDRKRKGQNPFGHARKKIYGTTTGKWEVAVIVVIKSIEHHFYI